MGVALTVQDGSGVGEEAHCTIHALAEHVNQPVPFLQQSEREISTMANSEQTQMWRHRVSGELCRQGEGFTSLDHWERVTFNETTGTWVWGWPGHTVRVEEAVPRPDDAWPRDAGLYTDSKSDPAVMEETPIKGYRHLSAVELELVNKVKAHAELTRELIGELEIQNAKGGVFGAVDVAIDMRWLALGRTDLQKGFMALVRSITRPETF